MHSKKSINMAKKAGMNDYVTKPIEPDKLFSILERNIKVRE